MKIHLRFNESNSEHTRVTIFVNDANCGELCLRTSEVGSFHQIVSMGCVGRDDEFKSSGTVCEVGQQ